MVYWFLGGKAPEPFRQMAHLNSSAVYCVHQSADGLGALTAWALQFESSWPVDSMYFHWD